MSIIRIHVLEVAEIDGLSMVPALDPGDRVVYLSRGCDGTPTHDDILVFTHDHRVYVKRAMGLADDVLWIRDRAFFRNGERLELPPIHTGDLAELRVPDGDVFFMGDNLNGSIDSRSFGPVPEENILGRVLFVLGRVLFVLPRFPAR